MTGIEGARALLPFWVVWAPVLVFVPAAFLLSLAGARAGAALALGRPGRGEGTTWVERARRGFAARRAAAVNLLLLPLLVGLLALLLSGPVCPVPPGVIALLCALASYAGAAVVGIRLERGLLAGKFPLRDYLWNVPLTWLVFRPWLIVLLVVFVCLPERAGPRAWAILAAGGVALVFALAGGGLFLARLVGLARPASPRLQGVVERAAAEVGVRPRGVYEIDVPLANAYALPLLRRLAFTPALLSALDDEGLHAVCAHELAHLAEPAGVGLARLVPGLLLLPFVACKLLVPYGPPVFVTAGVALFLLCLVARVAVGSLGRRMERRADSLGKSREGPEGAYARALATLYEVNLLPAVHLGRGTHPHLYDRLKAAGAPPDYPRPAGPSTFRVVLGVLVPAAMVLAVALGLRVGDARARDPARLGEPALFRALAFRGGGAPALADLAYARFERGDEADAAVFYEAATEADPASVFYPANLAIVLARLGRCDEAGRAAGEARRRSAGRGERAGERRVVEQAWQAVEGCRVREGRGRGRAEGAAGED